MRLPDFSPLGSSIWLRRSGVLMAFHGLAEVRATHHGKCADSHIGLAVVEALVPRVERMEELDSLEEQEQHGGKRNEEMTRARFYASTTRTESGAV
jgi:hypothetical protein